MSSGGVFILAGALPASADGWWVRAGSGSGPELMLEGRVRGEIGNVEFGVRALRRGAPHDVRASVAVGTRLGRFLLGTQSGWDGRRGPGWTTALGRRRPRAAPRLSMARDHPGLGWVLASRKLRAALGVGRDAGGVAYGAARFGSGPLGVAVRRLGSVSEVTAACHVGAPVSFQVEVVAGDLRRGMRLGVGGAPFPVGALLEIFREPGGFIWRGATGFVFRNGLMRGLRLEQRVERRSGEADPRGTRLVSWGRRLGSWRFESRARSIRTAEEEELRGDAEITWQWMPGWRVALRADLGRSPRSRFRLDRAARGWRGGVELDLPGSRARRGTVWVSRVSSWSWRVRVRWDGDRRTLLELEAGAPVGGGIV